MGGRGDVTKVSSRSVRAVVVSSTLHHLSAVALFPCMLHALDFSCYCCY